MASCHLYSLSSTLRYMEEGKLHVMETLHNWGLVFEPHRHNEYVMYFGSIGSIMSRLGFPKAHRRKGNGWFVVEKEGAEINTESFYCASDKMEQDASQ